jgi:hypothetical protein
MSISACAWAMDQRPQTSLHKLVLLLIADEADPDGLAFLDVPNLARLALVTGQRLSLVINELEQDGFIARTGERWGGREGFRLPTTDGDTP